MRRPRRQKAAVKSGGTPQNWSGLESLEGRLLLSTAIITPITSPTNLAPDSASIVFSEAVTGVDLTNIEIHQDAAPVATPGGAAITDTGDGIHWNLTGIAGAFTTDATYELILKTGANIVDVDTADGSDTLTADAGTSFVLDTTAPDAPSKPVLDAGSDSGTLGDNITNVTTPQINGTAEAGASVEVFDGATSLGTTTADGGGNWTFTTGVLTDGVHSLTATATDAAGNTSDASDALVLTIDTVAAAPAGLALDSGSDSGTLGDNLTNVTTPQINGTAEAGASVEVFDGATSLGTTTADGGGNWTFTTGVLTDGDHTFTAAQTDVAGNVSAASDGLTVTIDTTAPIVSTSTVVTTSGRPGLSGTIDDPTATILVKIGNASAPATNNGDGTWTLPAGTIAALPDGMYHVTVTATDTVGNQRVFTDALVIVDTTAPVVTVNRLTTTDTSPALSGTINDNGAEIVVTVNGVSYNAVNNGDGTWSLAAGTITPPLAQGVYNVTATATDTVGHVASDASTNELAIASTQSVTLGAGISKVTYVDADGTTVTISSSKGNVSISFTGVNLTLTQTGKTTYAVTATGGVKQVNINVVQNTSSLTFKTNAQGDGLTSINQIIGGGVLGTLSATGANLVGGINMTGAIKSIKLHNIQSDIVMTGTWNKSKGVTIAANIIKNSTIQADSIYSLKATILSDSSIQTGIISSLVANILADTNIVATTIKNLKAGVSYQNTNVTATTITSALLYNVDVDNGGAGFGLTASTIKTLKLKQGSTVLTWNKNFTAGIEDFFVTLV